MDVARFAWWRLPFWVSVLVVVLMIYQGERRDTAKEEAADARIDHLIQVGEADRERARRSDRQLRHDLDELTVYTKGLLEWIIQQGYPIPSYLLSIPEPDNDDNDDGGGDDDDSGGGDRVTAPKAPTSPESTRQPTQTPTDPNPVDELIKGTDKATREITGQIEDTIKDVEENLNDSLDAGR